MRSLLVTCMLSLAANLAIASESLVDEPDGRAYNFVSHYSIEIAAPAEMVWQHLTNLGSWMYDFEMTPVSDLNELEGRILQLYEGQDFYVQITKAIPNKLLVIANLPTTMEGETLSSGVSVTNLTTKNGVTTVDLTMSRRYIWNGTGKNHIKSRRQSKLFIENTRATWNRFLGKLSELSITKISTTD